MYTITSVHGDRWETSSMEEARHYAESLVRRGALVVRVKRDDGYTLSFSQHQDGGVQVRAMINGQDVPLRSPLGLE